MAVMKIILIFSTLATSSLAQSRHSLTPPWPGPYWDIPGAFCTDQYPQMKCCPGRQDRCSVPILGTLCYCDTFCNRTTNSDCCPDYFSHCEGLAADKLYYQEGPQAATLLRPPQDCQHGVLNLANPVCLYKGREVSERETVQDNCNQCQCQVSRVKPGCMEIMCSTNKCMLEEEVMKELEDGERTSLYTWKPSNNSDFWGKTLEDGKNGKLGAKRPEGRYMSAIHLSYSPSSLPPEFSSLSTWPGLVTPVPDQGWCSSSWAVSSASVAGDRAGISAGKQLLLSPAALLPCPARCEAGQVGHAWHAIRKHGLWDKDCAMDTATCNNREVNNCTRYRTKPAYRIGRENIPTQQMRREQDIMYEMMTQGPVQAVMVVYTDFFMYGSGVYQKTNLASSTVVGYHAVRMVGWGEEEGLKYWKVANSWGREWGEEGFFRIKRGDNECLVEEFVVGAWPRKQRRRARRRRMRRSRRMVEEGDPIQ